MNYSQAEIKYILEAGRFITTFGVHLVVYLGNTQHSISPEDLVKIVKDPNQWCADAYGVPKELFIAWDAFIRSHARCTGITRSGKQCRNELYPYPTVHRFHPRISDRCRFHEEQE